MWEESSHDLAHSYYSISLQNRRDFLRISGEEGQRRGKRELRAREGSLKNPACPHTIVQAVPAFKYECSYLIGYFQTCDPRMFFQDVARSRTVIRINNRSICTKIVRWI